MNTNPNVGVSSSGPGSYNSDTWQESTSPNSISRESQEFPLQVNVLTPNMFLHTDQKCNNMNPQDRSLESLPVESPPLQPNMMSQTNQNCQTNTQDRSLEGLPPSSPFWTCTACRMPRNTDRNKVCFKCHAARGSPFPRRPTTPTPPSSLWNPPPPPTSSGPPSALQVSLHLRNTPPTSSLSTATASLPLNGTTHHQGVAPVVQEQLTTLAKMQGAQLQQQQQQINIQRKEIKDLQEELHLEKQKKARQALLLQSMALMSTGVNGLVGLGDGNGNTRVQGRTNGARIQYQVTPTPQQLQQQQDEEEEQQWLAQLAVATSSLNGAVQNNQQQVRVNERDGIDGTNGGYGRNGGNGSGGSGGSGGRDNFIPRNNMPSSHSKLSNNNHGNTISTRNLGREIRTVSRAASRREKLRYRNSKIKKA
jgi:hypothetical protein